MNKEYLNIENNNNENIINIYHGSTKKHLEPMYGKGKKHNDYGRGFYTTEDRELAKEWAAMYDSNNSYCYHYELNIENLEILKLNELSILHWLAELFQNRVLNIDSDAISDRLDLFLEKYKLDTAYYDIIIGYRADDSYFNYAEEFLRGGIYLDELENILKLGNLGNQVFIKSERAFIRLKEIDVETLNKNQCSSYYQKFKRRDDTARSTYFNKKNIKRRNTKSRKTIFDIL